MSKMAEMDQTIKELRDAAAAINSAADWQKLKQSGGSDVLVGSGAAKAKKLFRSEEHTSELQSHA